jgi:hypothetical protein
LWENLNLKFCTPKVFFILGFKIHSEIQIYCNFTFSANLHSFVLSTWRVHTVSFCIFGEGTHIYCAYLQICMAENRLKIYFILLCCRKCGHHPVYSVKVHRFIPWIPRINTDSFRIFRKDTNIILIIWNQIIFFNSF